MKELFFVHRLSNGLTLVCERMAHVVSAAMDLAVPLGAARDGRELAGAAALISEWLLRGAGRRDSRQLNEALDHLGCQHDESVHSEWLHLSAAQIHQNLRDVLNLYGDIVRRPRLGAETFEPCRDLALQELAGLPDQPSRKCMLELVERFYPAPLGASPLGSSEALAAMTDDACRRHARRWLAPEGTILAVAGQVDWDALVGWAEEIFGGWTGAAFEPPATTAAAGGIAQETRDTAQVQIALAYDAPTIDSEHYYPARLAEMVLSGGMSGRLFTEVREKRGLVYSVSARYRAVKGAAGMFVYAGTTPQRAQQTLDVTVGELKRLAADGITEQELTTGKTQLKSALIMQGERTSARAGGLVGDWHLLGRLRSLEEIAAAVDAVSVEQVGACLKAYPPEAFTGYFIGPQPLNTDGLEG
ncbi:MAG: insulinase family protein [Planctomycetes bacterium]|nr:insulinase family protein [Planctomycetota bacterium]